MSLRGTILQPWNWHTPKMDGRNLNLWQRLEADAHAIKEDGFTAVWLPPACETEKKDTQGYDVKNWKNLNGTKYGDELQLHNACSNLRNHGIQVYHDQVHNHLMGGNKEKDIWVLSVKMNNKNEKVNDRCKWFQADIHSDFPWLELNHNHFDAYHPNGHECWALANKSFDKEAKQDPLMGCDLDFDNIELVKKLEECGNEFKYKIHTDGYRFDAVKHIRPKGTLNFLTAMRHSAQKNLFAVGEFLDENIHDLHKYITDTLGQISLFDVPLQRKLVHVSQQGRNYNMANIFDGTLTKDQPSLSVPFVHSHDDQDGIFGGASRGHYVGDWFISQAYALILLRDQGYPMVADIDMLKHGDMIKRYMVARTECTFGDIDNKFDHPNTVGWAFSGGHGYDNSMAVVLTTGDYGHKTLRTKRPYTTYRDLTGALHHTITTDYEGKANFECPAGKTSVWVEDSKFTYIMNKLY